MTQGRTPNAKRLALVISSLTSGGAERVMTQLANHWANSFEVHLITFSAKNIAPFYPLDPKVTLVPLACTTHHTSFFWRAMAFFNRFLTLRRTLKTLAPDQIISFMDLVNLIVLLASRGLGIPVTVCERVDPNQHKVPCFVGFLRRILYPLAHKIVVQTHSAASFFTGRAAPRLCIIPNAVPPMTPMRAPSQGPPLRLICVGRLEPQKDHLTLLRAFAQLAPRYPTLTLTIYGEGSLRSSLEAFVRDQSLMDRVHLPGVTQDIPKALGEADIFVFPSLYEGFPNALSEAMAMGLGVIASACSGSQDVVKDGVNGLLFPVGDPVSLAQCLTRLVEDGALFEAISKNAPHITQDYSPMRIMALWDNLVLQS